MPQVPRTWGPGLEAGSKGLIGGKALTSVAARCAWPGLTRLWDTAEAHIMFEEKPAGVQSFGFEGRTIRRDEPPMSDLPAEQPDETE